MLQGKPTKQNTVYIPTVDVGYVNGSDCEIVRYTLPVDNRGSPAK